MNKILDSILGGEGQDGQLLEIKWVNSQKTRKQCFGLSSAAQNYPKQFTLTVHSSYKQATGIESLGSRARQTLVWSQLCHPLAVYSC